MPKAGIHVARIGNPMPVERRRGADVTRSMWVGCSLNSVYYFVSCINGCHRSLPCIVLLFECLVVSMHIIVGFSIRSTGGLIPRRAWVVLRGWYCAKEQFFGAVLAAQL